MAQRHQGDRQRWMKEMRQYKAEFIAKSLKLSDEQRQKFIPLYEEMEAQTNELQDQVRRMEKSVTEKGDKATDLELEKAAEAMTELKGKENVVEMRYFAEFKKVLDKRQLFQIKSAERKFTKELMRHNRQSKGKK